MSWLLAVTERVAQMREQQVLRYTDPEWVKMAALPPLSQIDWQLVRLRGRYAYALPGVEVA